MKRGLGVWGLGVWSFFLISLPARAEYASKFPKVTSAAKEAYALKSIEKLMRIMNVHREGCKSLSADEVDPCLVAEAQDAGRNYELIPKSIRLFPVRPSSTREISNFLFATNEEIDEVSFQVIHDIGGKEGRVIQEARLFLVTSDAVDDKEHCADQAGLAACRRTCPYRNGTQAIASVIGSAEGRYFFGIESCFSLHVTYDDLIEPIVLARSLIPDDSYAKAPRKTADGVDVNVSLK